MMVSTGGGDKIQKLGFVGWGMVSNKKECK
jgi:hypothetical protein